MRFILVAVCTVLMTGCSTIMAGSTRHVEIDSQPSGLAVEILDHKGKVIDRGVTPFTRDLKRGRGYFQAADQTIRIESFPYDGREFPIKYGVTPWYVFGNFVFGGLIGWVGVDPATGAMYDLPGKIMLDCTEAEVAAESSDRKSRSGHIAGMP